MEPGKEAVSGEEGLEEPSTRGATIAVSIIIVEFFAIQHCVADAIPRPCCQGASIIAVYDISRIAYGGSTVLPAGAFAQSNADAVPGEGTAVGVLSTDAVLATTSITTRTP